MSIASTLFPAPGSFERMTALDASFLHAETDRTPLHIGTLSIFEGAPFFDDKGNFRLEDVQARVAERLHLFPRFRKRVETVALGQGRPVWVDDLDFDIENHVKLMVLPEPGSRDELAALCTRLHMRTLDRARPLWELWFVGGLDDGNIAMIEKVHHAMIDGVSGVDVAAALLDVEREVDPLDVPAWTPTAPPEPIPLLSESLRERLIEPAEWMRTIRAQLRGPREVLTRLTGLIDGLSAFTPKAIRTASSLNAQVGDERRLAWVTVPLEEVRTAAHRHDAKVNDVVLAAVTAGVRDLLSSRGESLRETELHALVPVSMRSDDDHGTLGNHVSGIVAPLPLNASTAAGRLSSVRDAMAVRKQRHQAEGTELLTESLDLLPPAVLSLATKAVHRQPLINVVVTNIPGPPFPLYFLGARMLETIPIVPLAGNLTVGIAILSYDGDLTVGLYADRDRCPDLDVLTKGIEAGFDDYLAEDIETG